MSISNLTLELKIKGLNALSRKYARGRIAFYHSYDFYCEIDESTPDEVYVVHGESCSYYPLNGCIGFIVHPNQELNYSQELFEAVVETDDSKAVVDALLLDETLFKEFCQVFKKQETAIMKHEHKKNGRKKAFSKRRMKKIQFEFGQREKCEVVQLFKQSA